VYSACQPVKKQQTTNNNTTMGNSNSNLQLLNDVYSFEKALRESNHIDYVSEFYETKPAVPGMFHFHLSLIILIIK
jgi:hypothetical protein